MGTIPTPEQMRPYGIKDLKGQHSMMMSFCHGYGIHDVFTNINVPSQQELMFVFPVMYKESDTEEAKLCSYVPVLYLDSKLGVIGGLYYGLKKEFHPEMTHNTTLTASSWYVKDIIQASFTDTGNSE